MMFNPFPNLFESYYFLTLPHNPFYFNCDPWINSTKTESNIILVKGQAESRNELLQEEKHLDARENQHKQDRNHKRQKQYLTQRRQKRNKTQKQVLLKRQKKVTKQPKKVDMVQKQGRNSHSNILRKFFKLLSLESEFHSTVQKIITRFGFDMEVDHYFDQVRARNIDHRNYIRVKEVQGLFEYNSSSINKITRTLFQNYLKNYYVEHLLSSKKTDNKSIVFHLKGKRTIREEILVKKSLENQSNEESVSSAD